MKRYKITVIGAGIIGLACALELKRRGHNVQVIEKLANISSNTSSLSTGILAQNGNGSLKFLSPFRKKYISSLRFFPKWVKRISHYSQENIECKLCKDYYLYNLNDLNEQEYFQNLTTRLVEEQAIDGKFLEKIPTFLENKINQSNKQWKIVLFKKNRTIDCLQLMQGLEKATKNIGVKLYFNQVLKNIVVSKEEIISETQGKTFKSDKILITSGVYSPIITNLLQYKMKVIPVKGEYLTIKSFLPIGTVLKFSGGRDYFINRKDICLFGATQELKNWSEKRNLSNIDELLRKIKRYFPNEKIEILEHFSGMRPRTSNKHPFVGFIDSNHQIAVCCGHYKSGIGFAPQTSQEIANIIENPLLFKNQPSLFSPIRKRGVVSYKSSDKFCLNFPFH